MQASTPANRAALRKVLCAYRYAIGAAMEAKAAFRFSAYYDACIVSAGLRAQAYLLLESGARRID
jgi:predicted nucleic acid-binding protein